jgi:RNA polymerase sigma-70 factor, ECF subfamily
MQDYADQLAALQPLLVRVALKKLRNHAWAEDAVSETLLAALAKPNAFAGRSTLKTWLIGILLNQSVNQIRLHTRECQLAGFDDPYGDGESDPMDHVVAHGASGPLGSHDDPQENLRQRQFIIEVERCLQSLPATQARAFVLRHGEEEDTGAICAELGVSRTNLHVLLHRARNHLRAAMAA